MKRLAIIEVRGRTGEWGIPAQLSDQTIEDMRADGVEIIVPENSVPGWIVSAGLVTPWIFLQDIYLLRNPWRRP